jgi:hypothetical protein
MALIHRGKSVYYYRSQRVGGRPRSVYVASGPDAELLAAWDSRWRQECRRHARRMRALDDRRRELRRQLRDRRREEAALLAEMGAAVALWCWATSGLFKAEMARRGWRLYQRYRWVRVRTMKTKSKRTKATKPATLAEAPPAATTPSEAAEFRKELEGYWERARRGDPAGRAAIEALFAHPPGGLIEFLGGDPLTRLEDMLVVRYDVGIAGEALRRHLAAMRESITVPDASSLDNLLVGQVVVTWLHMTLLQIRGLRAVELAGIDKDLARGADVVLKALSVAGRQFNAAVRSLTALRRATAPRPVPPAVSLSITVPPPAPPAPEPADLVPEILSRRGRRVSTTPSN